MTNTFLNKLILDDDDYGIGDDEIENEENEENDVEETDDKKEKINEKETVKKFGLCPECKELRIPNQWCQPCSAKHFQENFSNWESGHKELDDLIQESQINSTGTISFLEFIDFKKFYEFNYLNEGRFTKTYSAIWTDGYIQNWNIDKKSWERISDTKVILNYVPELETLLQKVKDYLKYNNLRIFRRPYGISKDLSTQEWIIVLKYEIGENLYSCLANYYQFNWLNKLDILVGIIISLSEMHQARFIHGDLNPNMILVTNVKDKKIIYIDFSELLDVESIDQAKNYCVLSYVAPEVLQSKKYTTYSDIYSFGIIMSIFATGQSPYHDYLAHEGILIVDICQGLRPVIEIENVPNCYRELMNKCWNMDPSKRPSAIEISKRLSKWWQSLIREQNTSITNEFKIADEMILKNGKNNIKLITADKENFNTNVKKNAHKWLQNTIQNGRIKFIHFDQLIEQKPLDAGHFGSITKAIWTKTNNYIVFKRLTNAIDIKNKILDAFIHELQMHMRLDLSNRIIRCLGISQDEVRKEYLLVMEYANDGDLCDYLKRNEKNLKWDNKMKLSFQIAEGLDYLHSVNILHRDLHSKNIVICNDDAKITDFGLSKVENKMSSIHSENFGVIFYMEPQRIDNKTFEYKKYSDIYSFGVLMWEISSCRRPFEKCITLGDISLLKLELIKGERETPVPGTPQNYKDLYEWCWHKNVNERPTFQEVLNKFSEMGFKNSLCNNYNPKSIEDKSSNNEDTQKERIDENNLNPSRNELHMDFDNFIVDWNNLKISDNQDEQSPTDSDLSGSTKYDDDDLSSYQDDYNVDLFIISGN